MDLDRNVIINVKIMLFYLTVINVLIYKGTKNK